jgi:hypothetical protein
MLRSQFDPGELAWFSGNAAQVADRPIHAPGNVHDIADLDLVERRHGDGGRDLRESELKVLQVTNATRAKR